MDLWEWNSHWVLHQQDTKTDMLLAILCIVLLVLVLEVEQHLDFAFWICA
jgi:hypothetical protein